MHRPVAWTVGLLAVTCLVAGIDALLASAAGQQPTLYYVSEIAVALVWAAVGALAVVIRPNRRVGWLMQVLGLVLMLNAPMGFILATQQRWVTIDLVVARVAQPFQIAVFAHLLLAYPDGRLHRLPQRRFIAAAYFYAVVVGAVGAVITVDLVTKPGWAGANPPAGLTGAGSSAALNLGWIALAAAYLILLAGKVRRATQRERRILAYPLMCGLFIILLFLFAVSLDILGLPPSPLSDALPYSSMLAMPGAFLMGLVRERLDYGLVAEFVRTIEGAPIGQLQAALRKALHDPTLEIAFPRAGQYVGEQGAVVPLPTDGSKAVLPIGGDPPIAVVLHDPSLREEPKLLTAASAATHLALDNARLHALVQQQLAEVRASRRRIVDAGIDQRRRLERDLHDGAQQRMLAVGIALQLLERRLGSDHPAASEMLGEAQRELLAAIEELRELARGIHPAILTEQGLDAAIRALARRIPLPVTIDDAVPRRFPPPVEAAAYFVVSEALSNVVKHSQATHASVRLTAVADRLRVEVVDNGVGGADPDRGSGFRGLADRAAAFEGFLSVTDALPTGTRLVVELRCA